MTYIILNILPFPYTIKFSNIDTIKLLQRLFLFESLTIELRHKIIILDTSIEYYCYFQHNNDNILLKYDC